MTRDELAGYLDTMTAAATEAGQLIFDYYQQDIAVDFKGPDDPVTAADRDANQLICERLRTAYPDACVVAEESDPESYADYQKSELVFVVDPLDGTKEFVARNGEFAVMLGVVVGERPVAGVIYAPESRTLWRGAQGLGLEEIDGQGNIREVRVTDERELRVASILTSRSHRSELLVSTLKRLQITRPVIMGSAGLKGASVASGKFDGWLAPGFAGKRWDACAAEALVVAGGGRFTDLSGNLIDYRAADLGNKHGIVAGNPFIHEQMLQGLASGR